MYNGEINAEKLDNWIRQLEVYCRIQNLHEDDIKIQLASLRMEGSAFVWWEARTQEEIQNYGNISMSWSSLFMPLKGNSIHYLTGKRPLWTRKFLDN